MHFIVTCVRMVGPIPPLPSPSKVSLVAAEPAWAGSSKTLSRMLGRNLCVSVWVFTSCRNLKSRSAVSWPSEKFSWNCARQTLVYLCHASRDWAAPASFLCDSPIPVGYFTGIWSHCSPGRLRHPCWICSNIASGLLMEQIESHPQ